VCVCVCVGGVGVGGGGGWVGNLVLFIFLPQCKYKLICGMTINFANSPTRALKALVWFDDVDISAFHSCVVVDLWQSLCEWHLLLSACVLVCRRENVGT